MQAKVGAEYQLSLAAAVAVAASVRLLTGSMVLGPMSSLAQARCTTTLAGETPAKRKPEWKIMGCEQVCVFRRNRALASTRKLEVQGLQNDQCKMTLRATGAMGCPTLRATSSSVAFTEGATADEGANSALDDFIFDSSRTTTMAHKVWQRVVRPGDTVVDATCGNGHDTLMLAKMVLQDGIAGYVIGLDLQQSALDNTNALLNRQLSSQQREKVSLLQLCHSQLGKVVDDNSVRLIVFNLGYQPGGDKSFITQAETTAQAVAAATRALEQQGLISIMSYVGHPGGREEHEAVRDFVSSLPADKWICSHLEWINRPLCPHLTFLLKRQNLS